DPGFMLGVGLEHYLSRRVSIRGQLPGAWWGLDDSRDDDSVSPLGFVGNLVYNWERGTWHPYATAGFGVYKFRFTERDIDSHDAPVGFNLGGGIEYFIG